VLSKNCITLTGNCCKPTNFRGLNFRYLGIDREIREIYMPRKFPRIRYKEGFGDLNKDFWAGLELMHTLTQRGQWEMRVDYQFNNKTWSYLHYNQFSVGSANQEYLLTVGGFTGVGNNWFAYQNRWKFSTVDNDNDRAVSLNSADYHKSGFWYNYCIHINLNQQPP